MADMNEMIQALGPGLGHMLAIQQQRNSQNQVQAQTGATLESTLRSQQQRRFDSDKHPLSLQEMMLKNETSTLGNEVQRRANQIEAGIPVKDAITARKQKMYGDSQKQVMSAMPGIVASASALPVEERTQYIQNELLRNGANEYYVEQLMRIPPDKIVDVMGAGMARIQAEATPKINSAEKLKQDQLDVTREMGYVKAQTEAWKAQMRQAIDEARLKIATAKGAGQGAKIPKRLEEALVKANYDVIEAQKRGDEKGEMEALKMAKLVAEQIAAINVTRQQTGPMLTPQGTITQKPQGALAPPIPVAPPTGLGTPGPVQGPVGTQKRMSVQDYLKQNGK